MNHITSSAKQDCDLAFADQVRRESGAAIDRCYQCLTCTLGCDAGYAMDFAPNQIVRMSQLGLKSAVLGSTSIWVCTACESCVTRCPNDIDIPHLMDTLHQIALREGVRVPEPAVPTFHRVFLEPVRQFGRQFEVMMTGMFILKAKKFSLKDLAANAALGMRMFLRRKLKFMPHTIQDKQAMGNIFKRTLEGGDK